MCVLHYMKTWEGQLGYKASVPQSLINNNYLICIQIMMLNKSLITFSYSYNCVTHISYYAGFNYAGLRLTIETAS